MPENNYETPDSNLIVETDEDLQLASRFHRLIASIVDTIIMLLIIGPFMYATGRYDKIF